MQKFKYVFLSLVQMKEITVQKKEKTEQKVGKLNELTKKDHLQKRKSLYLIKIK